jgi:hypothetical protein
MTLKLGESRVAMAKENKQKECFQLRYLAPWASGTAF